MKAADRDGCALRKNSKTGSGKGDKMNTELKEAIEALEKEKNIMRETL